MHQTKIDAFRVFEDKADWDEKNKKERRSEQTNECSSPSVAINTIGFVSLSLTLSTLSSSRSTSAYFIVNCVKKIISIRSLPIWIWIRSRKCVL